MMIEYVNNSGDEKYRDNELIPFAREVLLFFDKHYQRDSDGKIKLDPAMVLEISGINLYVCESDNVDLQESD